MTFTRPYSIWRAFNPLNIIGYMIGYADCDCGNNLWRYGDNPGYSNSFHGGRCICDGCYNEFKDAIKVNDHLIEGGGSSCWNKDCELHGKNPRFTWVSGNWCANAWKDRDYYGRYLKDGWGTHIAPED